MSLELFYKNKDSLLKNFICPLCNSHFTFKLLNNKTLIIVCTNDKCIFPLSEKEMDNFIYNENSMKFDDFFSRIKKTLNSHFSSEDITENKIDEIDNESENSLENMSNNNNENIFGSPLSSIDKINSIDFGF